MWRTDDQVQQASTPPADDNITQIDGQHGNRRELHMTIAAAMLPQKSRPEGRLFRVTVQVVELRGRAYARKEPIEVIAISAVSFRITPESAIIRAPITRSRTRHILSLVT